MQCIKDYRVNQEGENECKLYAAKWLTEPCHEFAYMQARVDQSDNNKYTYIRLYPLFPFLIDCVSRAIVMVWVPSPNRSPLIHFPAKNI